MTHRRGAILALVLLATSGEARAQSTSPAAETKTSADERAWWEEEESSRVRGYLGAIVGVGVGANGQLDAGIETYVDTSALLAFRGGLLLGRGHRWIFGFEVAPTTDRLDWRLRGTAMGFVSFGSLVDVRNRRDWAWLWKVGVGVGGGFDYRLMVAAQLDVLTFNYEMSDRLWVDFGIPTIRFHIETADRARYNAQFVFSLGITFAI